MSVGGGRPLPASASSSDEGAKLTPVVDPATILSGRVQAKLIETGRNRHGRNEWSAKVIVVGDVSVGKTALVERFGKNSFVQGYKSTIGVDYISKTYDIYSQDFTLRIWDTAGDERFQSVARNYYRASKAALLCYDTTNPSTLNDLPMWHSRVMENAGGEVTMLLVGCKSDLKCEVPEAAVRAMAEKLGCSFATCSAKKDEGVREIFDGLALKLLNTQVEESINWQEGTSGRQAETLSKVDLMKPVKKESKCAC